MNVPAPRTPDMFPTPLNTMSRVVSSMDPEYAARDARAVEDPIAATFELAESVDRQTPKIRKMLRYVRWFAFLWLVLDFFLMLILSRDPRITLLLFAPVVGLLFALRYAGDATTRTVVFVAAIIFGILQVISFRETLLLGAVLEVLFFLGFIILDLMRDLRTFFDYFALRHRVILAVRAANPVVHVPQGKDAATRILSHLASTSPDLRAVIALPGALASPALLTGKSGLTYSFDAYVRSEPSALSRTLGIGHPGFSVFVKAFDHAPTLSDLQSLRTAVEDVCVATRIPPARVVLVWKASGDESVGPDTYEFLTHQAAHVTLRGAAYACCLELARVGDDGTYDFIPYVVQPVSPGARTAPS